MKTTRYKLFALLLALLLVLPSAFVSCGSKAPALEEVRDEFSALIEASYEINEIFFGAGLPTHDREGEFAIENFMYYGFEGYDAYEFVVEDSPYHSVEDVKYAAAAVYSADYLEEISTMAFVGYADETTGAVSTARYLDSPEGYFLRYVFGETDPFNILPGARRYLFDTMQIVKPSSGTSVNVTVDSYLLGQEDELLTVTLRFVYENEAWRLDTPTY